MCVVVPNFMAICQTVVEIWGFSIFSNMAVVCHLVFVVRLFVPPMHLVVFITVQNLVGIGAVEF